MLNQETRSRCERNFGIVEYDGKKYWITSETEIESHGRDDVSYYATAISYDKNDDNDYMIEWITTKEWDAAWLLHEMRDTLNHLKDSANEYYDTTRINKEIENLEEKIDDLVNEYGEIEYYVDDESYACDWTDPISVRAM